MDKLFDAEAPDIMAVYNLAIDTSHFLGESDRHSESASLTLTKSITWICYLALDNHANVLKQLPVAMQVSIKDNKLLPVHFTRQIEGNSNAAENRRSRIKLYAEFLGNKQYQDEADLCAKLRTWLTMDQIKEARDKEDPGITGKKSRKKSSKPRPPSKANRQPGAEHEQWPTHRDLLLKQRPVTIIDQFDDAVTSLELGELGVALVTQTKDGKVGILSFVRGTTTEHKAVVQACIEQLTSISCAALQKRDDSAEIDDPGDAEEESRDAV